MNSASPSTSTAKSPVHQPDQLQQKEEKSRMPYIQPDTQTLHTPEGRYFRKATPPFNGALGCGHESADQNQAWQRVTSLKPEPALPETICTNCLERYIQEFATQDRPAPG